MHPTPEKVVAIKDAPDSTSSTQLRSFLGLLNYYYKFLHNLAAKLAPLHTLLSKHQKWIWGDDQKRAFQCAKEALQSGALLTHYDPRKPLELVCDAIDYGIGAVLSHVVDNSHERPIAYISHTLSSAEQHNSQLEKEAFSNCFCSQQISWLLVGPSICDGVRLPPSQKHCQVKLIPFLRLLPLELSDGQSYCLHTLTQLATSQGNPTAIQMLSVDYLVHPQPHSIVFLPMLLQS